MCSLLVAIQVLIKLFIELLDPFLESAGASQKCVSCGSRSLITRDDTAVQSIPLSVRAGATEGWESTESPAWACSIPGLGSTAVMQHKGQGQEMIHPSSVQHAGRDQKRSQPCRQEEPAEPALHSRLDVGCWIHLPGCLYRNAPPAARCALKAASGAGEGQ